MDKSLYRYVFFEDLEFGWVITHSQYRRLREMGSAFELPDGGFGFPDRKLLELAFA